MTKKDPKTPDAESTEGISAETLENLSDNKGGDSDEQ